MSHWNYRIAHRTVPDGLGEYEEVYDIREVFYDDDGNINGWSAEPIAPQGSSYLELIEELARMITTSKDILHLTSDGATRTTKEEV